MKLRNPIRSFADIEEFLSTMISRVPSIPTSVQKKLVRALPIMCLACGSILIAATIVPLISSVESVDPLSNSGLILINVVLFRFAFVLFGVILIGSYGLLSKRQLRGWYNIFYLSIFHVFFLIILFNYYSLLLLLVTWYVLFNVKKHFV